MNDTRLDARFDGEAESRFSLELYEKGKCYKCTAILSKKEPAGIISQVRFTMIPLLEPNAYSLGMTVKLASRHPGSQRVGNLVGMTAMNGMHIRTFNFTCQRSNTLILSTPTLLCCLHTCPMVVVRRS